MLFYFFSGQQPFFGGYAIEPLAGFDAKRLTPVIEYIQLYDRPANDDRLFEPQGQCMSWRVVNRDGRLVASREDRASEIAHLEWPHDVDRRIRRAHIGAPEEGSLLYLLCGWIRLDMDETDLALLESEDHWVDYTLEFFDTDGHPTLDRDEDENGLSRFLGNESGLLIPVDQLQ